MKANTKKSGVRGVLKSRARLEDVLPESLEENHIGVDSGTVRLIDNKLILLI